MRQGEFLVQQWQDSRMNGFQPHRHLQRAVEQIAKTQSFLAHQARMRLNHDAPGECNLTRNGEVIGERNGCGIKEIAAIVKLDLLRLTTELRERMFNLLRNCAGRDGLGRRIFPEIAHQASPRALLIGQQNRGRSQVPIGRWFGVLEKKSMRLERAKGRRARWSQRRDPSRSILCWKCRIHTSASVTYKAPETVCDIRIPGRTRAGEDARRAPRRVESGAWGKPEIPA